MTSKESTLNAVVSDGVDDGDIGIHWPTGAVLALIIAPPLMVQMASDAASWIPTTLASVLSGVTPEIGTDVGAVSAALGIALWAIVPAAVGLVMVQRRDVV